MTISLFSSFTSAAGARKPLGRTLNPGFMEVIEPIIPIKGGRRMRTCKPDTNVSTSRGAGGSDEIGRGMITSGLEPL